MTTIKGLETTFNSVYAQYDKWRPSYLKELYDDIFDAKEINALSNVLEIGIGTGQATLPILETGCKLTAIELGDKLAEYSKCKLKIMRTLMLKIFHFRSFNVSLISSI